MITLADKLSEKSNDDGLRATFYKKAALIYYDRDIFDVSLKYNMTAYDYYKIKDQSKASEIENVLAIINAGLNQKETALEHFRKIYSYNKSIGNRELSSKALNNIGTIYLDDKKADSALHNYQKAVKELGDLNNPNLKITINTNIARALAEKTIPRRPNILRMWKAFSGCPRILLSTHLFTVTSQNFIIRKKMPNWPSNMQSWPNHTPP